MSAAGPLILASSSRYRCELLQRLALPFEVDRPDIDESPLPGEAPLALVERLAVEKARAVGKRHAGALVIGSDQLAVFDGQTLGKPGTNTRAAQQLRQVSGRSVVFLTAICLLNTTTDTHQIDTVPFTIHFRTLSDAHIDQYLRLEDPLDCAGAIRSERLGITLFERMQGDDPTALMGLPLIRLTQMMAEQGLDVLGAPR